MIAPGVDTKTCDAKTFGNDASAARVDTKSPAVESFGNDTVGFIRVRRRTLKGGHPDWHEYRQRIQPETLFSASFDLVKAVRVGGKPRHQFLLGLGSQKAARPGCHDRVVDFWVTAIFRLKRHGLDAAQRRRLLTQMVAKGARLPSPVQYQQKLDDQAERTRRNYFPPSAADRAAMDELIALVEFISAESPT